MENFSTSAGSKLQLSGPNGTSFELVVYNAPVSKLEQLSTIGASLGIEKATFEDTLVKIKPYFADIPSLLAVEEDWPHQPWHTEEVVQYVKWMSDWAKLPTSDRDKAIAIGEDHDLGYKFVELGALEPAEHHIGSAAISLAKRSDPEIAQGVMIHVKDEISSDFPVWMRVPLYADRLAGMGVSGGIRTAWYLGYRDGKWFKEGKLYETRHPNLISFLPEWPVAYPIGGFSYNDFEEEQYEYWEANVLPWLVSSGLAGQAALNAKLWVTRYQGHFMQNIDGVESSEFRGLFWTKEENTLLLIGDLCEGISLEKLNSLGLLQPWD